MEEQDKVEQAKALLQEWEKQDKKFQYFLLHTYMTPQGNVRGAGDWAVEYDVLKRLFKNAIRAKWSLVGILYEAVKEILDEDKEQQEQEEQDNEEDNKIQE